MTAADARSPIRSALRNAEARSVALFVIFGLAACASLIAALSVGSLPIGFSEVLHNLFTATDGVAHDVIWNLRAPRAFAAFACGALLAFAGALLQVLLRNALADPYILGVSGGASLGALLAVSVGAGAAAMSLSAFVGAAAAIAIVFGLTYRTGDW